MDDLVSIAKANGLDSATGDSIATVKPRPVIASESDSTTGNRLFLVLYALIGLTCIFFVPYLVPMQPTASFSYHFGYSNRAGIILLVLFLAGAAILTRGANLSFLPASSSRPVNRKLLLGSLLAVSLGCLVMYALAGRFGGFGESSYNIDRAWLLLQGKTPYIDFEWPFGVYFLYFPVFLCRVLSLDVVRASYVVWGITFLFGTCLLFAVVNLIDYPTSKKNAIFLLLMAAAYPDLLSMGTPGALLRHIAAIFCILLVQRLHSRGELQQRIWAAFLGGACTILILLISPEVASSYAFACLCLFGLNVIRDRSESNVFLMALLVVEFSFIFWTAKRYHVLDTMLVSAGGADSLPIIPAPHILLFFAGTLLCAFYISRRFVDSRVSDNTFGIIAYSIPMLAPALGRCDAPHVFLDGLGIFLVCLFYISNHPGVWRFGRLAFLCFVVVLPTITGLWFYTPYFGSVFLDTLEESQNSKIVNDSLTFTQRQIAPHLSGEKREQFEARLRRVRLHIEDHGTTSLAALYPQWHGGFAAPFGYRPNRLGSDLTERIDYGFYEGLENANTPEAVRRKIQELAAEPQRALLLPERFDDDCRVDAAWERNVISLLFCFPYRGKVAHSDNVHGPLCDYIHAQYRKEDPKAASKDGYSLWIRKSSDDLPQ